MRKQPFILVNEHSQVCNIVASILIPFLSAHYVKKKLNQKKLSHFQIYLSPGSVLPSFLCHSLKVAVKHVCDRQGVVGTLTIFMYY